MPVETGDSYDLSNGELGLSLRWSRRHTISGVWDFSTRRLEASRSRVWDLRRVRSRYSRRVGEDPCCADPAGIRANRQGRGHLSSDRFIHRRHRARSDRGCSCKQAPARVGRERVCMVASGRRRALARPHSDWEALCSPLLHGPSERRSHVGWPPPALERGSAVRLPERVCSQLEELTDHTFSR